MTTEPIPGAGVARAALPKIAPHLVRPLMFALPVCKDDRFPPWMVDVDLWMYDCLALFKTERWHKTMRSARRLFRPAAHLRPGRARGRPRAGADCRRGSDECARTLNLSRAFRM